MEIFACEITFKKKRHQKIANQLYRSQTDYVVLQIDIKFSQRNGSLLSTR